MNQELSFKSFILFILAWTIIVGGLFFGVHETLEHSDQFSTLAEDYSDSHSSPLHDNLYIRSDISFIVSVSEVRDAGVAKEVIKQLEKNSKGSYIVILALALCFLIAASSLHSSVMSALFALTNIIFSRRSIISYIHNQDGNK